jgi:hypothetical protein
VLGLVRTSATEIHGTTPIARELESQVSVLADAIERLASNPGPWPGDLLEDVRKLAAGTIVHPAAPPAERDALTASILRAAADDLSRVVQAGAPQTSAPQNGRS